MTAESPTAESPTAGPSAFEHDLEVVRPDALRSGAWAALERLLRARAKAGVTRGVESRRVVIVLPPAPDRSWTEARRAARRRLDRVLASAAPIDRVIVLSSMRATGATERSAGFANEQQVAPSSDAGARSWRAYEQEMLACASSRPDLAVCVVRCCLGQGVDDPTFRLLEGRCVATWLGFDPPIQVLPAEELVERIWELTRVSRDLLPKILHVAPDDAVPLSIWLRRRGRFRVPVPGFMHVIASRGGGLNVEARRALQYPTTLDNERGRRLFGRASLYRMAEPDAPFDEMGWKRSAVERLGRWWMEPLRKLYWRVGDRHADRIPRVGPTILVGIHRGYVPLDAMMLLHLVRRRTGRTVRFLIHPALLKWPFLANLFPSIGGLVASAANAERVLSSGGLLGVFPEGANAAMIETRKAYPLQPFLSDDFAHWAVQWNARVVPVALVGPAEALPIFRRIRWRWWRRVIGWPTLPIGFLFPFGPPIPLPTKWHILFLEPLGPEDFEHEDEGERASALARTVRTRLDRAVREMVRRRRSLWFGDLRPEE